MSQNSGGGAAGGSIWARRKVQREVAYPMTSKPSLRRSKRMAL